VRRELGVGVTSWRIAAMLFGAGETTAAYGLAFVMLAICGLVFVTVAKILEHVAGKQL
jgi:hypothetical protein